MTSREAKQILLLGRFRPDDPDDPQWREAMRLVERDPELEEWWHGQRVFHAAVRDQLRSLPVPEGLESSILQRAKGGYVQHWWQQPAWWAAAAALVLLSALLLSRWTDRAPDQFAHWRSRMIGNTVRLYGMDLVTDREDALRQYLADHAAPNDYVVPPTLSDLPLTGGGALRWRDHPVAMVCFEGRQQEIWILYVIDQNAIPDPPGQVPQREIVNHMPVETWTRANRCYLLMKTDSPVPVTPP